MKSIQSTVFVVLLALSGALAQSATVKPPTSISPVASEKHWATSILLWMRTDKPRQASMDRWKGPHSKIISAAKGRREYRQIHLAETNTGLWSSITNVETTIPADRKVDGVAEVTFANLLSPLRGNKQTKLAFADEVNLFKRTIMYLGKPNWTRWYQVNASNDSVGASALVFLRKRADVTDKAFRSFVDNEFGPALAGTGALTELRTQVFMPWNPKRWNSPNVAHDNPVDAQFQASVMLGFRSRADRDAFLAGSAVRELAAPLATYCSAVHAYDVSEAITFVKDKKIIR